MKKLSDIFMKKGLSIQRESVKVEKCRNCGKIIKEFVSDNKPVTFRYIHQLWIENN